MLRLIFIFIIFCGGIMAVFFLLQPKPNSSGIPAPLSVVDFMARQNTDGYARAYSPRSFIFPHDHGPHPEFQTEWWYYTGNVTTIDGRHFGFQFTIFRFAITPNALPSRSPWATNQIYMAHFAVTDVAAQRFYSFERFSRGANGLAGAEGIPFKIWVEDWSAASNEADRFVRFPAMKILAAEPPIAIDLELRNSKPVVLHGNRGLSPKGIEPGNASYYYSLPRMSVHGKIRIKDHIFEVIGDAWLDREWSTSALGPDQVGWDWFALQLSDDRELMYYQIRNRHEQAKGFSRGSWIDKDGQCQQLNPSDVDLQILDHWISPNGDRYPSKWELKIPKHQLQLTITPYLADQELKLSFRYWEGAVKIEGYSSGKRISGKGYATSGIASDQ